MSSYTFHTIKFIGVLSAFFAIFPMGCSQKSGGGGGIVNDGGAQSPFPSPGAQQSVTPADPGQTDDLQGLPSHCRLTSATTPAPTSGAGSSPSVSPLPQNPFASPSPSPAASGVPAPTAIDEFASIMKEQEKRACNSSGNVYDRIATTCLTDVRVASYTCTADGVVAAMPDALKELMKKELETNRQACYLLDQCGDKAGNGYIVLLKKELAPNVGATIHQRVLQPRLE